MNELERLNVAPPLTMASHPEHYAVVPPSIRSKACDCGKAAFAEEKHYSGEGVWATEYKCSDCRDITLPRSGE